MNTSSSVRRSPAHHALEELNPVWGRVHNMKVPLRFNDSARETRLKTELSICDMSCLPKMGVKGPEALAWLAQAQIPVPEGIYGSCALADDGLVIRTGREEVFLEDGFTSHRITELEHQLQSRPSGVYLVGRQDASFLLGGARSNSVLRETCGIDFSSPSDGRVMTRVAGVSCMVLPVQVTGTPGVRLWLDPSYGSYLWEALLEIVRHHGGDAIGFDAFDPSIWQANSSKAQST